MCLQGRKIVPADFIAPVSTQNPLANDHHSVHLLSCIYRRYCVDDVPFARCWHSPVLKHAIDIETLASRLFTDSAQQLLGTARSPDAWEGKQTQQQQQQQQQEQRLIAGHVASFWCSPLLCLVLFSCFLAECEVTMPRRAH